MISDWPADLKVSYDSPEFKVVQSTQPHNDMNVSEDTW